MRKNYRRTNNKDYWNKRWSDIPADMPMENSNVYPLKYALMTIESKEGKILEAGCGTGRVLRYFKESGYDILGIDFIKCAIDKLKEADSGLNVEVGDITSLKCPDKEFRYVLAFGLYHNFEDGPDKALRETFRVLEPNGRVCASFRADNIQTKFSDWLAESRSKKNHGGSQASKFHKMNFTKCEFVDAFKKTGFDIEEVYSVENMPFLYKFRAFRARSQKVFDENIARRDGYQLNWCGQFLQSFLIKFFLDNFCNIFVVIARKPDSSD